MTSTLPALRRFVRRALVQAAGASPAGPADLGPAFDTLCSMLRAKLQPVFGATATTALFARAVHLSTQEFPWLLDVLPRGVERCSVDRLASLDSRLAPQTIEEGLATVLAHDIWLLSAFIGEDFVLPLVQQAWSTAATVVNPADSLDEV